MINDKRPPSLIIISGPTGVGKTEVGISLAEPIRGEIISADAMQVYRYMDIGTAKPGKEQRSRVPHHLIDVVDPDEPFSAALFKTMADSVITRLHRVGCPVFVVGGTGLYIKVLTRGLFQLRGQDPAVRKRLKAEAESLGLEVLHQRLEHIDPEAAKRIHPNDTYRIIRALEIFELTGKPLTRHHQAHSFSERPYRLLKIGLLIDRKMLYERINKRTHEMIASGLLREVEWLLDQGYSPELKSMQSIGYRHMTQYLKGALAWDEAVRLFKRDTRRYAKRQLTWFRADPEIRWIEPTQIGLMRKMIDSFLTESVHDA